MISACPPLSVVSGEILYFDESRGVGNSTLLLCDAGFTPLLYHDVRICDNDSRWFPWDPFECVEEDVA